MVVVVLGARGAGGEQQPGRQPEAANAGDGDVDHESDSCGGYDSTYTVRRASVPGVNTHCLPPPTIVSFAPHERGRSRRRWGGSRSGCRRGVARVAPPTSRPGGPRRTTRPFARIPHPASRIPRPASRVPFRHMTDATETAPTSAPGFWSAAKEALRGSRQDYTRGPVGRAILLLAIPMVLEMVMESVFAVADVFYV